MFFLLIQMVGNQIIMDIIMENRECISIIMGLNDMKIARFVDYNKNDIFEIEIIFFIFSFNIDFKIIFKYLFYNYYIIFLKLKNIYIFLLKYL